jgi:hypothetical protein
MPTLNVAVKVNGIPLQRAYVEHLVLGVGQPAMYMTDDQGRVRDQSGNLGIDSFTRNADIRVLCQNSVVKVLDGNTPGPLAVNQDISIVDDSIVDLNSAAEQQSHYDILERCLVAYDVIFRQFRPFSDGPDPDFPLGRAASLRATKDQSKRNELSFPSQFSLGHLAFTEPKSAATGYPLVHIRRRDSDGRLFGENGHNPTLIASEFAHALHFSLFSSAGRTRIETDYTGWIASDIANGGQGTHAMGRRTSPAVAYIEALDHFSSRFSEFVRRSLQGGTLNRLRPQQITAAMRQDFLDKELNGLSVEGTSVATLDGAGRVVPNAAFNGSDDEGSVYGCIFVDFARRVGLRTAANAYLRSASSGALTFGEYKTWVKDNRPEHLNALKAAQQTWGL